MSRLAQNPTPEAQPLIAMRDVRASSLWYAELLGADTLTIVLCPSLPCATGKLSVGGITWIRLPHDKRSPAADRA